MIPGHDAEVLTRFRYLLMPWYPTWIAYRFTFAIDIYYYIWQPSLNFSIVVAFSRISAHQLFWLDSRYSIDYRMNTSSFIASSIWNRRLLVTDHDDWINFVRAYTSSYNWKICGIFCSLKSPQCILNYQHFSQIVKKFDCILTLNNFINNNWQNLSISFKSFVYEWNYWFIIAF